MATRYAASSRYTLSPGGRFAEPRANYRTPNNYRVYQVRDGDTIENLAHRLLGDHTRWWELAYINPQISNVMSLEVGSAIRIPV